MERPAQVPAELGTGSRLAHGADAPALAAPAQRPRLFNFDAQGLRVVGSQEEPWFVAKDVGDALGIQNIRQVLENLDEDEKGVCNAYTLGGPQEMLTVNESGLYCLIFRSRKPEARLFRKWVTAEVLPALRRTGRYEAGAYRPAYRLTAPTQQLMENDLQHYSRLLAALLDGQSKVMLRWPQVHAVIDRERLFFWLGDAMAAASGPVALWRRRSSYSRYLQRFWGHRVGIPGGYASLVAYGCGRHRTYCIERHEGGAA